MCGIVGMAGNGVILQDLNVLYDLGLTAQVRGMDSSGIYECNTRMKDFHKKEVLYREASDFSFFSWKYMDSLEASKKKDMLTNIYNNFFVIHTRSATIGTINIDNAQPISHGNVIVVHNGTMKDPEYLTGSPDVSDSRLLAQDISAVGLEEVCHNMHKDSQWALVVFDRSTKKISFARQAYRPLWFAVHKKRDVLYWASEAGQLRWILTRHGIDHENLFQLKDGVVWQTTPERIRSKGVFFEEVSTFYTVDDKFKVTWERDKPEKKVEPVAEVEEREEEKGKVIPLTIPSEGQSRHLPTNKLKVPGKDLSTICGMCGRKISVIEQYYIRKYSYVGYHDESTGRYFCDCVGIDESKKVH
jgi:asparagine synthetase B (glutamine-hydrolysing)